MTPLFDSELALARKRRALGRAAPGVDFLAARAAVDLGERLATVGRRFAEAAALFSWTGDAARALRESGKADRVVRVEADAAFLAGGEGVVASLETLPLPPASLDLAVSLLSLHEVNDLPGMLIQIRRALRPDGLFLAALPGSGSLGELRESLLAAESETGRGASPRVMPFTDVRDAGGLLQRAGFALPVADAETLTVRYDSMFALMADLRAMGAASVLVERSRRFASRRLFLRAAEIYAERFADADGRIRATFNILWLSGWAPHPSQQKPLAPGSAKMRLADALAAKIP